MDLRLRKKELRKIEQAIDEISSRTDSVNNELTNEESQKLDHYITVLEQSYNASRIAESHLKLVSSNFF